MRPLRRAAIDDASAAGTARAAASRATRTPTARTCGTSRSGSDSEREIHRSASLFVLHVELRTAFGEISHDRVIPALHGEMKKGLAIRIECVDVETVSNTKLDDFQYGRLIARAAAIQKDHGHVRVILLSEGRICSTFQQGPYYREIR